MMGELSCDCIERESFDTESIPVIGLVLIVTWFTFLLPLFLILLRYKRVQTGCGKMRNLYVVLS